MSTGTCVKILNSLRSGVKEVLKQEKKIHREGMDVALVTLQNLDEQNTLVEFVICLYIFLCQYLSIDICFHLFSNLTGSSPSILKPDCLFYVFAFDYRKFLINRVSKIIQNEYWCGYLSTVSTEI